MFVAGEIDTDGGEEGDFFDLSVIEAHFGMEGIDEDGKPVRFKRLRAEGIKFFSDEFGDVVESFLREGDIKGFKGAFDLADAVAVDEEGEEEFFIVFVSAFPVLREEGRAEGIAEADAGDSEVKFSEGEGEGAVIEAVGLIIRILLEEEIALFEHEMVEEGFEEGEEGGFLALGFGNDFLGDLFKEFIEIEGSFFFIHYPDLLSGLWFLLKKIPGHNF